MQSNTTHFHANESINDRRTKQITSPVAGVLVILFRKIAGKDDLLAAPP